MGSSIVTYPNAVTRTVRDKVGEHPSILDFGGKADGVTDNGPLLQMAIASLVSKGGGLLRIPASLTGQPYMINSKVTISSQVPITIEGEGVSSMFKRGASIPVGYGVFDYQNPSYVTFRDLVLDGGTTVSTGLNYASITGGDPMIDLLTQNSMFWVHGGNYLKWERVQIQHTSGYAILLDARQIYITDVQIVDCKLVNNRQYLFGNNNADLNYGSWTGGIFYKNDGVTYTTKVINMIVRGCRFERNTGNCIWGHGYGFGAQHENIKIDHNYFLDCGLDGILHGNTTTGSANNNNFRRIGFICTDDTSAAVPKYLANAFATALDTTGIAKDVSYSDNTFLDINGDYINGDGFSHGVIANNTMRLAASGSPEYTIDDVAAFGPSGTGAVSQGIVMNNSGNQADAGIDILVTGNRIENLPGTNIGMYACRLSTVIGNYLYPPPVMGVGQFPIALGNVGTGGNQRAYGNVVTKNLVYYAPTTSQGTVVEDATYGAFSTGDSNWVAGNFIVSQTGNAYEFKKDPNTVSVTSVVFSTKDVTSVPATHYFQREGAGTASALKIYYVENTTQYQHAQFQAYSLGTSTRSPLFNVSEAGVGGAFTTANRTLLPFQDVMATGKLYGDAFLELTDATYSDTDANAINGVVGGGSTGTAVIALFRYRGSVGIPQYSSSISAGTRVWTNFGPTYWTQSGTLLYPNNTAWKVLVGRATDDGSGAMLQVYGTSTQGSINAGGVIQSVATGTNLAFQANSGTFIVNGAGAVSCAGPLTVSGAAVSYLALIGRTSDNTSGATVQVHGNIWLDVNVSSAHGQTFGASGVGDSTIMDDQGFEGNFFRVKGGAGVGGADYFDWTRWGTATSALAQHIVQFRDSSNNVLINYDGASGALGGTYGQVTGTFTFAGLVAAYQGASKAGAFYPNGNGTTAPANPATGYGGVGYKSGSVYWYWNGSVWATVDFSAVGGSSFWTESGGLLYPTNNTDRVLINETTAKWANSLFEVHPTTNENFMVGPSTSVTGAVTLNFINDAATANIPVEIRATPVYLPVGGLIINSASNDGSGYYLQVTGGIEAVTGNILSKSTAANAFNANAGGVTATTGYWIGATQVVNSSGQWVGTGIVTGLTAGTAISVSAATGNVTITNTGVTSLAGSQGITVSASTGAVTVTVGSANVTFSPNNTYSIGGFSAGYINSPASIYAATGMATPLFRVQNTLDYFDRIVITAHKMGFRDSSGNMMATYDATGTPFYWNFSTGQGTAGGVVIADGYNVYAGGTYYTGQTATVVGSFTIGGTGYTNLFFRGGVLVSYS